MVRKIIKENEGVVGIIVAVLLIGLLVSVVSLIQSVYVPKWMEQKEAEHMDEVSSQFSQLKFAIDTQASTGELSTPIATSITLGSKELPFLMSVRAFGELEILSNSINLTLQNSTDTLSFSLGALKYSSVNAYYLDQSFIYQAGAIIIDQNEGNMLSIKPSFLVKDFSGDVKITIKAVDLIGIGGKVSGSGYGSTAIQTEYSSSDEFNITDVEFIKITTSYTNAWKTYLNWILEKELDSNAYSLTTNDNDITITLNQADVDLRIIDINAQIGAGWIE
jgi:hypothetical protein